VDVEGQEEGGEKEEEGEGEEGEVEGFLTLTLTEEGERVVRGGGGGAAAAVVSSKQSSSYSFPREEQES